MPNENPPTNPSTPEDPKLPPEENPGNDSPGVIIITFTARPENTDPVTGDTVLNFDVSLANQSEPTLTFSFYEVVPSSTTPNSLDYLPITVTNPPTVTWSSGVGTFALLMNSDIFDQLTSRQTNFAIKVQISGNSNSLGLFTFAIDLPSS